MLVKQTNGYQAYCRNKLITEALALSLSKGYLTGDIEKYGSGFMRIREELEQYPTMKLICKENSNGFLATLSYTKQKVSLASVTTGNKIRKGNEVKNGELKVKQKIVFNYIKTNPGIKAAQLSVKLKIPFSTIDKLIRVLLKKELIERRGSKKTGGYHALEKNTPIKYGPERIGDIPHSLASIEKAKTILNYNPSHTLEKGLQEAVKWYWENLG